MGLCTSSDHPEKRRNKEILETMRADAAQQGKVRKILLLGAGESGKSTLFKQAQIICGSGFTDRERQLYVPVITLNVLEGILTLIRHAEGSLDDVAKSVNYLRAIGEDLDFAESIDEKTAEHVTILWEHDTIQDTFAKRSEIQVQDSLRYFCNQIDKLARADYLPDNDDILHSRRATTGVVEMHFEMKRTELTMVDVGGQRNERRKWIHHFDHCHAVLFVAAISEFDQVLYEERDTNRLIEALYLFEEICNLQYFQNTHLILFLNKKDLLAEKLKNGKDLSVCFGDRYTGGQDYEQAIKFLIAEFGSRNHADDRIIYSHITCATDTATMENVFLDLFDIVLSDALVDIM